MTDLREAAVAELAALELSLASDPRYQKIKAIKDLLAVYGGHTPVSATPAPVRPVAYANAEAPVHPKNARLVLRRSNPDRERALNAAAEYIAERTLPTRTAEILTHLGELGIPVAGTVPLSNLSAMLHHSPLFQTHGRSGWTRAIDNAEENASLMEAGASAASENDDDEEDYGGL
ncbi:hypothetical protein [Caulobacter sp. DWR2-3-1b2]|uniref:hypothetical protein n=1 Tax=unclassified Caulobacter TaxID=2648921 RepID=UPI003CF36FAA